MIHGLTLKIDNFIGRNVLTQLVDLNFDTIQIEYANVTKKPVNLS